MERHFADSQPVTCVLLESVETRLIWALAIPLLLAAAGGAFLLFLVGRFICWALRGGRRVSIPWTVKGLPRMSRFAERRRSRDGASLKALDPNECTLVFWRRSWECGWEPILRDIVTGFTGIETVAADFSLEGDGERWLITSTALNRQRLSIDGPHYEPWRACKGSAIARVDLSRYLDGARLRSDLEECIADRSVRHQRSPWAFIAGRTNPKRVTCSGLIGQAILLQPASRAAVALREALDDRFTYGEITPADIAHAAAILGAPEARTGEPFSLGPSLGYFMKGAVLRLTGRGASVPNRPPRGFVPGVTQGMAPGMAPGTAPRASRLIS